jgi:hypothetical protein
VDIDELSDPVSRSWHRLTPRERALQSMPFLSYASGTNLGVWAEVFAKLGGFDVRTPTGEDIDFSWRAQLASYRLAHAPTAVVHERIRRRPRAVARQHLGYGAAGPHLYRRFARAGMPRSSIREAALTWCRLAVTGPGAALSATGRGRWCLEAGLASGRLVGSARNRVLFV